MATQPKINVKEIAKQMASIPKLIEENQKLASEAAALRKENETLRADLEKATQDVIAANSDADMLQDKLNALRGATSKVVNIMSAKQVQSVLAVPKAGAKKPAAKAKGGNRKSA